MCNPGMSLPAGVKYAEPFQGFRAQPYSSSDFPSVSRGYSLPQPSRSYQSPGISYSPKYTTSGFQKYQSPGASRNT